MMCEAKDIGCPYCDANRNNGNRHSHVCLASVVSIKDVPYKDLHATWRAGAAYGLEASDATIGNLPVSNATLCQVARMGAECASAAKRRGGDFLKRFVQTLTGKLDLSIKPPVAAVVLELP